MPAHIALLNGVNTDRSGVRYSYALMSGGGLVVVLKQRDEKVKALHRTRSFNIAYEVGQGTINNKDATLLLEHFIESVEFLDRGDIIRGPVIGRS